MLNKRYISLGIIITVCLLVAGRAGEIAVAQTAISPHTLYVTLVPNYTNHQVDIIGQIDETHCADVTYSWLNIDNEIRLPSTDNDEGHCLFQLFDQGEIVLEDEGIYYLRWPDLQLNEGDELSFSIPAVDILHDQMAVRLRPGWAPFQWQLTKDDIGSGLIIPFHPWQFDINLTINTLLDPVATGPLSSDTLLSGNVIISDIQDVNNYQWLIKPSLFDYPVEMLLTVIDYVPIQLSDIFPGFQTLASSKRQILWFQSHINTAQPPTKSQGGAINLNLVGRTYPLETSNSLSLPSLDPTDIQEIPPPPDISSSPTSNYKIKKIVLGLVRLAPHDRLSLHLADNFIVQAVPPPSQRPDVNTSVYQGPIHSDIEITRIETGMMLLKQIPFVIRSITLPLENMLNGQGAEAYAPVLALSTLGLALFIVNIYGQRWKSAVPFFLIWLSIGTILLYFTPAISSLLLLSLVVLQPYFHWKHRGESIIVVLLIGTVILDNLLLWSDPVWFNGERQHISYFTPVILLIFLLLSLVVITTRWEDAEKRVAESQKEKDGLSVVYLPALTMGFLVLATYEVINQSFLSFVIIVTIVAYTQHFSLKALAADKNREEKELFPETATLAQTISQKMWMVHTVYEPGKFARPGQAKPKATVTAVLDVRPSTVQQEISHSSLVWFYTLRHLLQRPFIIIGIIILALVALSPVTNTLDNVIFSLVTLLATINLFVILYELIPSSVGYYKAVLFIIPLLTIFLLGIGTASTTLTGPTQGITGHYILFLNQLDELLLGRIIYYLTVPLFIGLYLEFNHQRQQGKVKDVLQFLSSARSLMPLATAVLSALTPSLFQLITQQPVIATFADLIEQFLVISGS